MRRNKEQLHERINHYDFHNNNSEKKRHLTTTNIH